jgi:hypothetical protein
MSTLFSCARVDDIYVYIENGERESWGGKEGRKTRSGKK